MTKPRRLVVEKLENRHMLAANPWINLNEPLDVNADKHVTVRDALTVVNDINQRGVHSLLHRTRDAITPFFDVSNDQVLSYREALLVFRQLNVKPFFPGPEGEGGNNPPVGVDDDFTMLYPDGSLQGNVLDNDFDPDGDSLSVPQGNVTMEPANGTLQMNTDGSFTYTPNTDYVGFDSFMYMPSDGSENGTVAEALIHVEGVLNITIHNGGRPDENGNFVEGEAAALEELVGAFTVVNRNDTDGDGVADIDDDSVIAHFVDGKQKGTHEVDLMKLVIEKPQPWDPAQPVVLQHNSGDAAFYEFFTKVNQYELDAQGEYAFYFGANEDEKVIWVEATKLANYLRSIDINVRHVQSNGESASDLVRATGVWATMLDYHIGPPTMTPAQILALQPWSELGPADGVYIYLQYFGGTGVRPISLEYGARNFILMAWRLSPHGIHESGGAQFDITRRKDSLTLLDMTNTSNWVTLGEYVAFPDMLDLANDDSNDDDEDGPKPLTGNMFGADGPGFAIPLPPPGSINGTRLQQTMAFEEFVRVRFDNVRPLSNTLDGSRVSDKLNWSSRTSLVARQVPLIWERDPLDPNDLNVNDPGGGGGLP